MKTSIKVGMMALLVGAFLGAITKPAQAHTGSPAGTVWMDGSTLSATSLNNTIGHLHNTFSAGIIDSHINPSAAIQHTKLAQPGLVPKAWGTYVCPTDGGADCTLPEDLNIATVVVVDAGLYSVTLSYTPYDEYFLAHASATSGADTDVACNSFQHQINAPHFLVWCHTGASGVTAGFDVNVMDSN